MKKILLSFALLLSISTATFAQTQAVKLGPLGFLLGNYNARYEKALGEKTSFLIGANYLDFKLNNEGVTGFGVNLGYRYYFRKAIKSAYVFPSVGYDFLSTKFLDSKGKYSTLGLKALVGYQWIWGGGFTLDFGLGYGANFEITKDNALTSDYRRRGVRFLFNIGYAF